MIYHVINRGNYTQFSIPLTNDQRTAPLQEPVIFTIDRLIKSAMEKSPMGVDPIGRVAAACYRPAMNPVLLILVLLLLIGGGGFYLGGPAFGGGGIGLILLVCLIVYLMGGFRSKT